MLRRVYSPDEKANAFHTLEINAGDITATWHSGHGNGNLGVRHPLPHLPHLQPNHPPIIANFANNECQ